MKRPILLVLTLLLALPSLAQDQAQPIFLVSSYQCDRGSLDDLAASSAAHGAPILQAMVEDGKILTAGVARHLWGDEYNLIMWIGATDVAAAVAAGDEMTSSMGEEAMDRLMDSCPVHRDVFYRQLASTDGPPPPPIEAGSEPVLAISYFQCPYGDLGAILEDHRSRTMPISQQMVDDGALGTEQVYRHEFGDEWNLVFVRSARDLAALDSAVGDMNEEYDRMNGEDGVSVIDQHCTAHKDNLYSIVMIAGPTE